MQGGSHMERRRLEQEPEAVNLPGRMPDVLKRYSLALVLAGLALLLRGALPLLQGTAIYQLPIAAVVLSAWYGGRGPGLLASLICATGILYWFVPPVNSFELSPELCARFLHLPRAVPAPHASSVRGAGVPSTRCGRARSAFAPSWTLRPTRSWSMRRMEQSLT